MFQDNRFTGSDDDQSGTFAESMGYQQLLDLQTVENLRTLAEIAGIRLRAGMRKREIVSYLSSRIPSILDRLVTKLSASGRLLCETVVSAGGCLGIREARLRVEVELRRRSERACRGADDEGVEKERTMEDLKEELYRFVLGPGELAVERLFYFPIDPYHDGYYTSPSHVIVPKEARRFFTVRPLHLGLTSYDVSEPEARPLEHGELSDFLYAFLERISYSSASRPVDETASDEESLPERITRPIFEKYTEQSRVFREIDYAKLLDASDLDENMVPFALSTKLLRKSRGGYDVLPAGLQLLSSERDLHESFIEWWGSKNNRSSLVEDVPTFAFDEGLEGIRSDESLVRQIISMVIMGEMKPREWYSVESIIDTVRLESGRSLFGCHEITKWSSDGTTDDICGIACRLLIFWPLLILGVLETDGPGMKLVRLGSWASSPKQPIPKPQPITLDGFQGRITVTPNFEVIVQPEARMLAFQLMEFCERPEDAQRAVGPAFIFRITKSSVRRAFRRMNYTSERIVSFFADAGVNLPDNVLHELKEWGNKFGEVEFRAVETIECRDEVLAEALMNDTAVKKYVIRRIGKTTIEIKPGTWKKVRSRCDSLGLLSK